MNSLDTVLGITTQKTRGVSVGASPTRCFGVPLTKGGREAKRSEHSYTGEDDEIKIES